MATKRQAIIWKVVLTKNTNPGCAWLAQATSSTIEDGQTGEYFEAFSNASAAKRWVKAQTGRKTISWIDSGEDAKGKPTAFNAGYEVKV